MHERGPHLDLKRAILGRIRRDKAIGVWTPNDFLNLGTRSAVDKALQRLALSGDIRRIDRGLYDVPRANSLTGKLTVPDYTAIIDAVGRREKARFLPDGITAANQLGLTDAVPAKVTVHTLRKMKEEGDRIAMLTAYDATFSRLLDQAGTDILLVGDSAGMVIAGHANTLPVTMDETIYHCRAVARAAVRAQVVGDMPFMSYQTSVEDGIRNAGRLVKEGGAEAVKLEGGAEYAELAHRLSRIGIPVMGHIGLTPQSVHSLGGFKVQGRDSAGAKRILDDARALEQAGCYAIVLEGVPRDLARHVTEAVTIPTIGIGAGLECDGQVLVVYDMLGLNDVFRPKFVKRYDNLAVRVRTAVEKYVGEVKDGLFPTEEFSFGSEAPRVPQGIGSAPLRAAAAATGTTASGADGKAPRGNVIALPACGWPRSLDEK